jgi:hypothetical protein
VGSNVASYSKGPSLVPGSDSVVLTEVFNPRRDVRYMGEMAVP